jgi:hypothetical protein
MSLSALAEDLDKLISQAGEIGEDKCKRRRPKWFSTAIVQDLLEISHLTHYRNGLKFGRDRTQITTTNLNLIHRNQPLPFTLIMIEELLYKKETALASKLEKSAEIRQVELHEKDDKLDQTKDRKYAAIIRTITRKENGGAWCCPTGQGQSRPILPRSSSNDGMTCLRQEISILWTHFHHQYHHHQHYHHQHEFVASIFFFPR